MTHCCIRKIVFCERNPRVLCYMPECDLDVRCISRCATINENFTYDYVLDINYSIMKFLILIFGIVSLFILKARTENPRHPTILPGKFYRWIKVLLLNSNKRTIQKVGKTLWVVYNIVENNN